MNIEDLNSEKYSVVIDGKTISYYSLLENQQQEMFLDLITKASTCICCRLTPKQKSQMVRVLRKKKDKVALAVGDGANDVPMFFESSIGVGISGKEGTQVL